MNVLEKLCFFGIFLMFLCHCSEKEFDPNDAKKSFLVAREPYDKGHYDIAVKKLGEFKSRFPYDSSAVESELLVANCHFELGKYAESAASYQQFTKLHPKHPQVSFAWYRIGESYWSDAPSDVDREQDYTHKAVSAWEELLKLYPQSPEAPKAEGLIKEGKARLAKAEAFVAHFYCKQGIWHACAHRSLALLEKFPTHPELHDRAKADAKKALMILADDKDRSTKADENIYYRDWSKDQLIKKAGEL